MAMMHDQAKSIFLSAVEIASLQERQAFIAAQCGENGSLRDEVEGLLQHEKALGSFLESPAIGVAAINATPSIVEQPGTAIGPYKLLEQIGEGGMGVVYLAEQERPVRRRVALKIIKPGMDTRQVIARFDAERQALAMMDHPNIAKVLDAGTTGDGTRGWGLGTKDESSVASASGPSPQPPGPPLGRPYFVMELVQGVPITEYCDQCNLATRERLELFVTVCQAVQHAHQKGIIHRDIKPNNVLVAMLDGRPSPKIIDFGVAKAIGERLTEHTLTIAFAQMVGTPLYMSPEQAEISPLGVDTRSDIYSLGVVLYELLSGTTPFDKERLHAVPYDELRRIIREEEPPRPSVRISTLAADLATTISEHRRSDTRRLQQTVRGDLDWIVMKCLEKDRNRRYETPNSLARDMECYLHDEPVQACPPSMLYLLRKFARRNKVALAFSTLLVGGFVYLAYSNAAIKREREAKTAALSQATTPEDRVRLAEILTNQSRTVRGPEDARRLSMAAAVRTEEAHRHIRHAINAYDQMVIDYPNDLERRLEAIAGFVQVLSVCLAAPGFAGEVDELNRRLEAQLPKLVAGFPDSSECQWQSAMKYVDWAYALNRYPAYLSVKEHAYRKEIEILEKIALSNPKRPLVWLFLADAYDHLGNQYWESARTEDAAAAFLRAKEIYDEHSAEIAAEKQTQAYGITSHYVRLAYFLAHTHREDAAAECVRKAAEYATRITDPVQSVTVLWAMAPLQLRMGDHAGYRETCKALVDVPVADADDLTKARRIFTWSFGPDALDDLSLPVKHAEEVAANNSLGQRDFILFDLGAALYRDRQYKRAADELEASIEAYPSDPVPGYDPISFQRLFLAMTKWQLGQKDEARQLLEKTLPDVDKELQSPSRGWNQRAALEVIRREAQALIQPKEANEAVENENRTSDEPQQ